MTIFIIVIAWLVLGYIGARLVLNFMKPFDLPSDRPKAFRQGVVLGPVMLVTGIALQVTKACEDRRGPR